MVAFVVGLQRHYSKAVSKFGSPVRFQVAGLSRDCSVGFLDVTFALGVKGGNVVFLVGVVSFAASIICANLTSIAKVRYFRGI